MTPTLRDVTRCFARIGLMSFGGPAAQIALMHREIVDERQWVDEKSYLSALSFCMLLPGPEAMQLATWIGWRSHGWRGGLIAGGLFVLPGACVVLALSMIYAGYGELPLIAAMFSGVQAAVVAIVVEALLRVAKRALKSPPQRVIALFAFAALFVFALPFPVVILTAALWGYATARGTTAPTNPMPKANTLQTLALWATLWLAPLAALWLHGGILFDIAAYFAKLAVLTFGGAYAVLTWMAQTTVQDLGWLTLPQMMDGLGLAETTPGPLILVTEFVGYMAGYGAGGWALGLIAALVTLWMTFLPSFLFIFVGAPYLARLTANPRLNGALAAITAAVVGVIANLSLWFALHVLFARQIPIWHLSLPDLTSLQPLPCLIALAAAYALLARHWPLPIVLALAAAAPALWSLI